MSEDALRKSMKACNLYNVALVEEVHGRKTKGEGLNAICKDLEDFQRQIMGEIMYTANALKQRYLYAIGAKSNKVVQNEPVDLEGLAKIATDPDVQAKVEAFLNIPPEKPEPIVEAVPVVKSPSDFAEEVRRGLTQLNSIVTQRGHGFTDSEREAIRTVLALIFNNIGE